MSNPALPGTADYATLGNALHESFKAHLPHLFLQFIDQINGPASIKDTEGRFVYVNQVLAHLLGAAPAAIIGKTDYDFVSKEQADSIRSQELENTTGPGIQLLEEFTDHNGQLHVYRCRRFGIANAQGEWIGHALIGEEVTALEQAQLTIAEQKARIAGILNSYSESIWSVNRNFEIEFANDVMRRDFLQAFNTDLQPGVNILAALPELIRPAWHQRYEKVLAGETLDFQELVETPQASYYLRLRFYPIRVADKVVGMACFSKNVTTEVQAMRERNRFYELVEQQNGALKSMAHNHTHGMMPHLQQVMAAIAQLRQAQSDEARPGIETAVGAIEAAAAAIGSLIEHNVERLKTLDVSRNNSK